MTKSYVLPFVVYVAGTAVIGSLPENLYPIGYAVVVAASIASLVWAFRNRELGEERLIRPHAKVGLGIITGLVGIAVWIGVSHLHLESAISEWLPESIRPSERKSFNPLEELTSWQAIAFIVIRTIGLAAVVPLVEELFWRGFLLRWVIDPDWEEVEIGKFSWTSCFVVTGLFALAHPEWIAAAIYCLMINGLLYRTKDLWQCVVAHAVSNLVLVIYVLAYQQWWLW